MRKLAILSTALMGLAFAQNAYAQSEGAPQPGLPPGFSRGSPNAQPPSATGDLETTRVGPAVRATPPAPTVARLLPSQRRAARRAARRRARARTQQAAPAVTQ